MVIVRLTAAAMSMYLCGEPNRVRAVGYGALAILIFSPIIVSTGRLAAVCGGVGIPL